MIFLLLFRNAFCQSLSLLNSSRSLKAVAQLLGFFFCHNFLISQIKKTNQDSQGNSLGLRALDTFNVLVNFDSLPFFLVISAAHASQSALHSASALQQRTQMCIRVKTSKSEAGLCTVHPVTAKQINNPAECD